MFLSFVFVVCLLVEGSLSNSGGSDNDFQGGESSDDVIKIYVNITEAVNTIGPYFVGVTLDTSLLPTNWDTLNFRSQKVLNLAQALTPAYFRMGGTMADCLEFMPPDAKPPRDPYYDKCTNNTEGHKDINMTVTQWKEVYDFTLNAGFDFIMDLDALHRYTDDAWYPENTRQLLDFSAANNFRIAGFELGNEYDKYGTTFDYDMPPWRLARDYISLQILLGLYPEYASSMILGPETATVDGQYFEEFLVAGGADIVTAATFHHYYFSGKTSVPDNFTDVRIMDSLRGYLTPALTQARSVKASLPVWLSETSAAYAGGTPNASDRFVAGFLWLDKLGLCAEMGIKTVLRQEFYGDDHSLIDTDLNPNPDYWLTWLFKQLVQGSVFAVSGGQNLRVYAACARAYPESFGNGSLVVYYLNPNNSSQTFELPQFMGKKLILYVLTPGDTEGLTSRFVAVNGKKLELNGDELPELKPLSTDSSTVVTPPYSFGFVVIPAANVALCASKKG